MLVALKSSLLTLRPGDSPQDRGSPSAGLGTNIMAGQKKAKKNEANIQPSWPNKTGQLAKKRAVSLRETNLSFVSCRSTLEVVLIMSEFWKREFSEPVIQQGKDTEYVLTGMNDDKGTIW